MQRHRDYYLTDEELNIILRALGAATWNYSIHTLTKKLRERHAEDLKLEAVGK